MNLKRASLISIMFLLAATSILAQSSAPKRKFKHRGKIETKYDRFRNQTTVRLEPYYVQGTAPKLDPLAGIEISAGFVYEGQTLTKHPDEVLFGIVSTSADGFRYDQDRGLIALVDGERVDLGQMDRVDASYKKKGIVIPDRYYVEVLAISMKYDVFLKIANAKVVEMQAGRREFKLRDEHLEALRDLASRMVP
jgi:hypothetical protein